MNRYAMQSLRAFRASPYGRTFADDEQDPLATSSSDITGSATATGVKQQGSNANDVVAMAEGSWEPRSKKPRIGIYVLQCLQHEPLTVRLPENMNDEERRMEAARIAFPRPRSQHEEYATTGNPDRQGYWQLG